MYTGFAFRFEHRKWNRGCNRLPKLDHFLCSNLKANPVYAELTIRFLPKLYFTVPKAEKISHNDNLLFI